MAVDGNVTIANVLYDMAEIWIGTAGTYANEVQVGYTDGGVTISVDQQQQKIYADQAIDPILILDTERNVNITFNWMEASLANIAKSMPSVSLAGNVLTFGDYTTPTVSVRIVGTDPSGAQRVWRAPYMRASSTFQYHYSKNAVQMVAANFELLAQNGVAPLTISDAQTLQSTIADGTFALVAGQNTYVVLPEGDASDSLTDITGAVEADDGRVITLIPYNASASKTITVVHGTGTIELANDANFVMNSTNDRLVLTYSYSGTKWTETSRVS